MVNEKNKKKLDGSWPLKENCTGLNLHLYDFLPEGTLQLAHHGAAKTQAESHRLICLKNFRLQFWAARAVGKWRGLILKGRSIEGGDLKSAYHPNTVNCAYMSEIPRSLEKAKIWKAKRTEQVQLLPTAKKEFWIWVQPN